MRRICSVALVIAILLTLSPLLALAQPTSWQKQFWASPDYSIAGSTAQRAIGVIDSQGKFHRGIVSPYRGYLIAGVAGSAVVNMNHVGGTAVGGYFIAEGIGIGGGIQDEVTGVYARADKNGKFWATALHGECLVDFPDSGGICIGANVELYGANPNSKVIGINVQPKPETSGVIGLQFQNPETYRWTIDTANAPMRIGLNDVTSFCMKFEPKTTRLEFWHGCSAPGARRVGYIDMSYGAKDAKLNR